jgi:predicted dehydrogenase
LPPHTYNIGLIGYGEIGRLQHVRILASPPTRHTFRLVAVADPRLPHDLRLSHGGLDVTCHADYRELLARRDIDAVSVCTPTQTHYCIAAHALRAGKDVLLEKPPTMTVEELLRLQEIASGGGRVLYTAFHAIHHRAIEEVRARLATAEVTTVQIVWREDWRKWHSDQHWPWQAGGGGVFDPGINALSVLCYVLPDVTLEVTSAEFLVPSDADTPGTVKINFAFPNGSGQAFFNWLDETEEVWNITFTTKGDQIYLIENLSTLKKNGVVCVAEQDEEEYVGVYERFSQLLAQRTSAVSTAELKFIENASHIATRHTVGPVHV